MTNPICMMFLNQDPIFEGSRLNKSKNHVFVTGSPCCTVEKKMYWGKNNSKKRNMESQVKFVVTSLLIP